MNRPEVVPRKKKIGVGEDALPEGNLRDEGSPGICRPFMNDTTSVRFSPNKKLNPINYCGFCWCPSDRGESHRKGEEWENPCRERGRGRDENGEGNLGWFYEGWVGGWVGWRREMNRDG